MYKKVYLEITNNCNLNCPFCIKNNRDKKFISLEGYLNILNKLKSYTKYLYFHVMGEPLLHPDINQLIDIGSKDFFINITTNGYLINRIKNNHNIRQVNISLHSFSATYNVSLEKYINNICDVIDNLSERTYFSLRFWVNNKYNNEIIKFLNKKYKVNIKLENGVKIKNNVYVSINKEFIWPSFNNDYYSEFGTCYALRDHIGILVNGDIIPCCLDSDGIIKLGNIFENNLEEVINSNRYKKMLAGFKNNKKCEELCKKCNFLTVREEK